MLFVLFISACGNSSNEVLKIVTLEVPHAEILEQAKPILKEKGIDLMIIKYQDSGQDITSNEHLVTGKVDATYIQTLRHFEITEVVSEGNTLKNIGGVHIERLGLYSQKYTDLSEIPDGATVIMSDYVSDYGRILGMFQENGLIKLKEDVQIIQAGLEDIVENPKNLQFKIGTPLAELVQAYENEEGDIIAINASFAIEAGLNPTIDAVALENASDEFVNIIAVREEEANKKAFQTLIEVLQSEEIQKFILENYAGSVVPISG